MRGGLALQLEVQTVTGDTIGKSGVQGVGLEAVANDAGDRGAAQLPSIGADDLSDRLGRASQQIATPSKMPILAATTTAAGRSSYWVSAINRARSSVAPIFSPRADSRGHATRLCRSLTIRNPRFGSIN